jgi:vacuolar-type H+-ATPase subunit I/STV1
MKKIVIAVVLLSFSWCTQRFLIKYENLAQFQQIEKNIDESSRIKSTLSREITNEEHIAEFEKYLADELKAKIGEDVFKNSYAGKMLIKDPRVTIKLSEHAPERQKEMKEELEFIKANGYARLSQNEMDDYYKTKSELFSNGNAQDSAKFELSKVPEDLDIAYEGYTREGIYPYAPADAKAGVIRRVYNYNGSIVLLQEENGKNGVTHFTEEFVNENIGGYPGIFATYRSPDNRTIHELKWITDNRRYQLNSISNKSSAEERVTLVRLAQELTELNKI